MSCSDQERASLLAENAELRRRITDLEAHRRADPEPNDGQYRAFIDEFQGIAFRGAIGFRPVLIAGATEAITGYAAEDFLEGRIRIDQLVHPDDRAEFLTSTEPLRTTANSAIDREYRIVRRDGGIVWLREVTHNICDRSGKPILVQGLAHDITKRKLAEEALHESQERYRALAESSADVIYILDESGTLLYGNRTAAAYMRTTPEDLVGKTQRDLFPPAEAELHLQRIRTVFETGEMGEMDQHYVIKGQDVWLNVRSIPLRDEQGRVRSVMGVCRNITAWKQAELGLKRSRDELEERVKQRTAELASANQTLRMFKLFVENAGQGFGMANLDGQITYWNPTLCRMYGETHPEKVVGKHIADYYPQDYLALRQTVILPALMRDGQWQGELNLHARDGQTTPVLQNAFLIRDERGEPVRLAAVITDFTELKRAEEALRQSHDELQTLYDGMTDGLSVVDATTARLVRVNPVLCAVLGFSEAEILAMAPEERHPPGALEGLRAHFESVLQGTADSYFDMPCWTKAGDLRYFDTKSKHIVYAGRPALLVFMHDVTERRRAQEALEREQRTLKHLLQSSDHERQLIAYEIHDGLAQQLAGAIMQFQVYDHVKGTKPADAASAFQAGMTMLQQSHFETRRLISGVRPPILDEEGIVAAVSHLVNEERRKNGPKIEYLSHVEFDRLTPILENAVYRIVQEALANACQHSQSKKVRVGLEQSGDHLRIQVRDYGVGFRLDEIKGDRFGLEGIRERARLLGGKADIQSEKGKGTRIEVELPVVPRRPEDEAIQDA